MRNSEGLTFVPAFGETSVLVFDRSGSHLSRIGREGKGPGEFSYVGYLSLDRDSLRVFDYDGRMTVFAPDQRFARVQHWPFWVHRAIALPDGLTLASGGFRRTGSLGQPLHLITESGRLQKSFGTASPRVQPDRPSLENRKIALWKSRILAIRPDRYEVEQFTVNGTTERLIRRNATWFPAREYERGPPGTRPPPFVRDITVSGDGHLWVMLYVPSDDWAANRPKPGEPLTPGSLDDELDTVIEVIDLDRLSVLGRTRLSFVMEGFSSSDSAYRYDEDRLGDVIVRIFDLGLVNTTSSRRGQ